MDRDTYFTKMAPRNNSSWDLSYTSPNPFQTKFEFPLHGIHTHQLMDPAVFLFVVNKMIEEKITNFPK